MSAAAQVTAEEAGNGPAGLAERLRSAAAKVPQLLRILRQRRARRGSRGGARIWLLVLLLVQLAAFAWAVQALFGVTASGQRLTLDELAGLARQGLVQSATLRDADNRIVGRVADPPPVAPAPTKANLAKAGSAKAAKPATTKAPAAPAKPVVVTAPLNVHDYYVDYPANAPLTAELYRTLVAGNAEVAVDRQAGKQQLRLVSTFLLPLMILASVFALLLAPSRRGGNSGIGAIADFSTVRKGRVRKGSSVVTFADAGGVDEAVAEMQEVVDYLRNPAKYEALGAKPPKGVLLFGPPGCGKTLLAKSVAGEAGVPFFSVAGAEFVEALVGVGAARVRDLFARVRAAAPAIVFIDELDAAGRKRGSGGSSGGSDEREQTLNQLLVEMDGFDASTGVVVIGATNRPDILDPALRRPGRFDRHITIERPDLEGRARILAIHAKDKPLRPDVDLDRVARRTPGFTGADLANVMNEATLLAIREERAEVTAADVEEAIRRVLEGPKRRGHLLSEAERRRAAVHESGHLLVALERGEADLVHRVSILGNSRSIATTELRADDEDVMLTESQLRARLTVKLAGAAAERAVFGEITTGVERDFEEATTLARDMVARYGMVEELTPVRLLGPDTAVYLGDVTPWGEIAEDTRSTADTAIRQLLQDASSAARTVVELHRESLDDLTRSLLEHETLEGELLVQETAGVRLRLKGVPVDSDPVRPRGRRPARTAG
jgi:cell division protease FtsH